MERNVRLGLTWQVAVRTGVGHLPSGATACVGVFCIRGDNGLREDEAAATQQSLFSWAKFLAKERAQSQGRSGKPKPSSLFLLGWALTAEQAREKELVGSVRQAFTKKERPSLI